MAQVSNRRFLCISKGMYIDWQQVSECLSNALIVILISSRIRFHID